MVGTGVGQMMDARIRQASLRKTRNLACTGAGSLRPLWAGPAPQAGLRTDSLVRHLWSKFPRYRTASRVWLGLGSTSPQLTQSVSCFLHTLRSPFTLKHFQNNGCRHALDDHCPRRIPPGPHRCAPAGVARSRLADRPRRESPAYPPTRARSCLRPVGATSAPPLAVAVIR